MSGRRVRSSSSQPSRRYRCAAWLIRSVHPLPVTSLLSVYVRCMLFAPEALARASVHGTREAATSGQTRASHESAVVVRGVRGRVRVRSLHATYVASSPRGDFDDRLDT